MVGRLLCAQPTEVLEHPLRAALVQDVVENPRASLRERSARLDAPYRIVAYHLRVLEQAGILVRRSASLYESVNDIHVRSQFSDWTLRAVTEAILETPGTTCSDLQRILGTGAGALNRRISWLEEHGLVHLKRDGNAVRLHATAALATRDWSWPAN